MALIKGKNIDISAISFSEPKVLDNGAKLIYVNNKGGKFMIQTPWMELPWTMSCFNEGPYPKYSIDMSFRGVDENVDLQRFYDKIEQLDNRIIQYGIDNSVQLFKIKNASEDVVRAKYNTIIKLSKDKETGEPDGKYPASFKLKVPQRNDVWECSVKEKNGEFLDINNSDGEHILEDILVKNCKMRAIIQCVGIWVASGNYMCQWKLVTAEVESIAAKETESFIVDSDNEDDEHEDKQNKNLVDSSDEESDDGEPEETVVVKKKKKNNKK